jgi:prephenate dehydratase
MEKGIEDDDTNFTRFLLLARKDVVRFLNKKIASKTSIVFTLPDSPGTLSQVLCL